MMEKCCKTCIHRNDALEKRPMLVIPPIDAECFGCYRSGEPQNWEPMAEKYKEE